MDAKQVVMSVAVFVIAGIASSAAVRHVFAAARFSGCGDLDKPTCECAINAVKAWPDDDRKRVESLGKIPPSQWSAQDQRAVARELATCAMKVESEAIAGQLRDACVNALGDAELCGCIAREFFARRTADDLVDIMETGMQQRQSPSTLLQGMFQDLSFACSKKLGR